MNESDRAIEKLALERGGSVTKRKRFKEPHVKKPVNPRIDPREGDDKYHGKRLNLKIPGRYVCIREGVVLDWPELKPLNGK